MIMAAVPAFLFWSMTPPAGGLNPVLSDFRSAGEKRADCQNS
jgi:hypothetical protein